MLVPKQMVTTAKTIEKMTQNTTKIKHVFLNPVASDNPPPTIGPKADPNKYVVVSKAVVLSDRSLFYRSSCLLLNT